jgi:hypothetical protein
LKYVLILSVFIPKKRAPVYGSMASKKMSDPPMDKIDVHLEAPVFPLKNSATYALANRTKKVGERVEALRVVQRE